jgi:hypothetical protein
MELFDYNDRLQVRKLSEVDPKSINSNAINTIKNKNNKSTIYETENAELKDMHNI